MKRLFILPLIAFSACSLFEPVGEMFSTKEPLKAKPIKMVAKREPGSIWREDSRWNDFYSAAPSRNVGDVITIVLEESFKTRFRQLTKKENKKNDGSASNQDTPNFEATIQDIPSRGVYTVSAGKQIRVGNQEGVVLVEGNIRERDIHADDSMSSDALFNLKLEAKSMKTADAKPEPEKEKPVEEAKAEVPAPTKAGG